ncbi:MAG: aspartyl protease family protein [Sphingomonas sp.]
MNRPTKILLGAGALSASAAMCVAHPGHPPIPTPTVMVNDSAGPIPFRLFRGNRIMVPVRINGHETQVMLDTGASMTTLNRSYARSIGLPEGFKIQAKGVGGITQAELVSGLTINVGGFQTSNASVAVMDLADLERNIGRSISGIVGRDFFNAAVISIDWAKQQIRVRSPDAFRPTADAAAIDLTRKGPFNTIPISIAGAPPTEALLDIGNGGSLAVSRSYLNEHPELAGLRSAASQAGGVGGMRSARLATIPQVALAGVRFAGVPAIFADSGSDDDPTQMTNVGVGLLSKFRVDLDLGRSRIFLAPRRDKPLFERDRAGVRFDLLGDRLKTRFVSPDGPAAAAGLKEGDEIVAVDGRRVSAAYYDVGDWTKGPVGKQVVLDRADGSKIKVTLADYF